VGHWDHTGGDQSNKGSSPGRGLPPQRVRAMRTVEGLGGDLGVVAVQVSGSGRGGGGAGVRIGRSPHTYAARSTRGISEG
jgi:hypothetical protein